jgi:hypothetical protein
VPDRHAVLRARRPAPGGDGSVRKRVPLSDDFGHLDDPVPT